MKIQHFNINKVKARKLLHWLYTNNKRSALDGLVLLEIMNDQGVSPADLAEKVCGNREQSSSIDKSLKRLVDESLICIEHPDNTVRCTLHISPENAKNIKKMIF